ncbi:hypothetical protein DEU56DRAFT_735375, partial [Suillus clintonianus]|uniref:uncharacterized protein n=1 Tax=Suillus clintonianus TaxID=1904413 RepID=UPI001B87C264
GEQLVSIIHLDSIMCVAHLIGVYSSQFIPRTLKHTDSLLAVLAYYVGKKLGTIVILPDYKVGSVP